MPTPAGLQKPRRLALLIPLVLAAILVIGIAAFALAHLTAKGPAPQLTPAAERPTDQPVTRDGYTMEDFAEPKAK